MKVKSIRGLEEDKEYGRISRLVFPDGSRIYISKKGWSLVTPKKNKQQLNKIWRNINKEGRIELRIPFGEINCAIKETIKQGYKV